MWVTIQGSYSILGGISSFLILKDKIVYVCFAGKSVLSLSPSRLDPPQTDKSKCWLLVDEFLEVEQTFLVVNYPLYSLLRLPGCWNRIRTAKISK